MEFKFTPEQRKSMLDDDNMEIKQNIKNIQDMDVDVVNERIEYLKEKLQEVKKKKKVPAAASGENIINMSEQEREDFVFHMQKVSMLNHEMKQLKNLLAIGTEAAIDELLDKLIVNRDKLKQL